MGNNDGLCIICNGKASNIICDDCYNKLFQSEKKYDANQVKNAFTSKKLIGFSKVEERKLIYQLKTKNNKRLQKLVSFELSKCIKETLGDYQASDTAITYIPRRAPGKRDFGFDHKKILAEMVSKNLNLKLLDLFTFTIMIDNEGKDNYILSNKNRNVSSVKTLIILDDHSETGHTIERSCMLAKGLGIDKVFTLVVSE